MNEEMMRATINRNLVANHFGAKLYDRICHRRIDERIGVAEERHTQERLEAIAQETLDEENDPE